VSAEGDGRDYRVNVDDGTRLLSFEVYAHNVQEALANAGLLYESGEFEETK
jgi:hypothetical protein